MEKERQEKLEYLITNGIIKYSTISPKEETELDKDNLPNNIIKVHNMYYKIEDDMADTKKDFNFLLMSKLIRDVKTVKGIVKFFFVLFLIGLILLFFPFW